MNEEDINKLFRETISSQGFINLDQNDINNFKRGVNFIDAIKVSGKSEQVKDLLSGALFSLKQNNGEKLVKKLLFVIILPQKNRFLEHIGGIHDVLDELEENIECQWGLSTNEDLQGEQIEIVVSIGFKNKANI